MKNLFLMRHAHSPNSIFNDFERKITEEGVIKSKKVGAILNNYKIDVIYSSDSVRTQETVENLCKELVIIPKIEYHHSLYHCTEDSLLQFIKDAFLENDNILVVNHNPVVSQLSLLLCQAYKESELYNDIARGFSAASLIHFANNKLINFWR